MTGNDLRELQLQPGEYRINAYFENGYDIGGGLSHEIIRTRSATFSVDGQAGDTWLLDFNSPANLQEAQAMEENFSGEAVNTRTGQRVATVPGPAYVSLLGQMLGSGTHAVGDSTTGVAPLGAQSAQTSGQVAAPNAMAAIPVPSQAAAAQQTLPATDATLSTLKQLYLMLSPQSREDFINWAAK